MALHTAADVPLQVVSEHSASERRVSPAWTVAQFKARLEPITGVPAAAQSLSLRLGSSQPPVAVASEDEDATQLSSFPLQPYAEIRVTDTRPAAQRISFGDTSSVEKYTMPMSEYESKADSVLAYKRANQLGRFDPSLPSEQEQARARIDREIAERRISVGARCRLLPADSDDRRGEIAFIGEVPEIPGAVPGAKWIGVRLDEPVGKNDGSVAGSSVRYFDARGEKRGVFVRPERVEIGDFAPVDEFDSDMEEI